MKLSPATQTAVEAINLAEQALENFEDRALLDEADKAINAAGPQALREGATPSVLIGLEFYGARISAACRRKIYFHDYRSLFEEALPGSDKMIRGVRQRLFVLDAGFLQNHLGLAYPDQITDSTPLVEEAFKAGGRVQLAEISDALCVSRSDVAEKQRFDNPDSAFINQSHPWVIGQPLDEIRDRLNLVRRNSTNPDKEKRQKLIGNWWNITDLHSRVLEMCSTQGLLPSESVTLMSQIQGGQKIKEGETPTITFGETQVKITDADQCLELAKRKGGKIANAGRNAQLNGRQVFQNSRETVGITA